MTAQQTIGLAHGNGRHWLAIISRLAASLYCFSHRVTALGRLGRRESNLGMRITEKPIRICYCITHDQMLDVIRPIAARFCNTGDFTLSGLIRSVVLRSAHNTSPFRVGAGLVLEHFSVKPCPVPETCNQFSTRVDRGTRDSAVQCSVHCAVSQE